MRWLRRHDPQLLAVRRAGLVACLGFYFCRYVLDNPTMALYALFGAVALGALSQIPGTPGRHARTLLLVLPVARRLADAVGALAGCLAAVADDWDGDKSDKSGNLAALLPEATDAAEALRPSRLPAGGAIRVAANS